MSLGDPGFGAPAQLLGAQRRHVDEQESALDRRRRLAGSFGLLDSRRLAPAPGFQLQT